MPADSSSDVKFGIGHVLFIDIVGYSKLLINEQSEQIQKLKDIVRRTEQVRLAEAEGKLLRLPTGDGGALVFRSSPEAPVLCALEIGKELKKHPELRLRMGVHSGPVNEVVDLNEQANIAGAGINIAQRVMDCGDAGHILLSRRVAEDLEHYPQWRSLLHELGECEVKHGVRISIVNLYTNEIGNAALPGRFIPAEKKSLPSPKRLTAFPILLGMLILLVCLGVPALIFTPAILKSLRLKTRGETKPPIALQAAISQKSIAVLPFENLSSDKENAYFADGIQDEILTRVSKIADLKVISRTSTRRFKDSTESVPAIAQQLGVVNILEGSVQRSNDQVRVNVQLIDAQKDVHLWAQTYDRKLDDIFAVEAEIARNIAKILEAKLTGADERLLAARPTENTEAHKLYLQGSYYNERGTEGDYRQAIDCYKGAIRLDPNYVQAHTGLAFALTNLARKFLSSAEAQKAYAEARTAAETAITVDPDLATGHSARALVLYSDFKWAEAEAEYRRALQLEPNNDAVKTSLAGLLASLGRAGEAVELARQELANDPLCASCYNWLSTYLCSLGRLDEAEQAIQQAIHLQPGHTDFHTQLTIIAILRGDAKAALSAAQKEIAAGGWQEIALALAQQISGDPIAADAALKILIEHQPNDAAYQIAQVYALRKEPDKVFEWLERAWSNRDPGISGLLYDPFLVRYKDDPRFAAFCREVQLPPPASSAKQ